MAFSYRTSTLAIGSFSSHPSSSKMPSSSTCLTPSSSSSHNHPRTKFCFPSPPANSTSTNLCSFPFTLAIASPVSRRTTAIVSASSSDSSGRGRAAADKEEVFFDGGPHYGDLIVNLLFGFSIIWLPLTLAAVLRALFLRYRFSSFRVTILSGLTGEDRKDFSYEVIKDVEVLPRLIGEWGDVVITLSDGTKVDLRCVPKFRKIAEYCRKKSGQQQEEAEELAASVAGPKGFS